MNKPTMKTRGAVLYTRVSGEEQDKHGTSPETQRDACRAKALELGLPIIAEYYDGGVSGGFLLMRKEFQAALADIQAGRADTLICPSISRYSRDVEHQQAVKKTVKAAGGRLVFCDMTFEDTPEGDLNFTIQGGFAEYEKAVIRSRTMKGKRKQAGNGIQPARAFSPYGYHIVTKGDVLGGEYPAGSLGKYIVLEDQAQIVRWLYAAYAAGTHSLPQAMQHLNAEAVPTPRGAAIWRASSLRSILVNPVYKGFHVFGRWESFLDEGRLSQASRVTGQLYTTASARRALPASQQVSIPTPVIVPEEVWDRVQARLAENRTRRGGNPARIKMLSGRVFCPECDHKMILRGAEARKGENSDTYLCGHYHDLLKNTGERPCSGSRYLRRKTEAAVLRALHDAVHRPTVVAKALATYQRGMAEEQRKNGVREADPRKELATLDKRLADLAQQEASAVSAQIAGIRAGASPEAYAAVFAQIAAERKDLEDRRGVLSGRVAPRRENGTAKDGAALPVDITKILSEMQAVLTSDLIPGTAKRDALGLIIEKVICTKDGAEVKFVSGLFSAEDFGSAGGSGDTLHSVTVLNPPGGAEYGTAAAYGTGSDDATINNYSVGLQIDYGRTRFILTGDAQHEAEGAMLGAHAGLACDVLKAGHHGSKTATGEDWLSRLQPRFAVISCGRNNRFGHPAPSTLERLGAHGVDIYRTDKQGAITFVSDGKTVIARPYLR